MADDSMVTWIDQSALRTVFSATTDQIFMKLNRNMPLDTEMFDIFKMATVAMVTMKDKTIYFLSNCNKISQEWFLGCVDVHLGFDIFKMAAIGLVTMKVKKKMCFKSDSNETSQEWSFGCADVQQVFIELWISKRWISSWQWVFTSWVCLGDFVVGKLCEL